jgi:serine/threonine protein kinase
MNDQASANKQWISSLSEGGVGFKVWDSTFDLELDDEYDARLTRDFDSDLLALTPLPVAPKIAEDPFAELNTSQRPQLVRYLTPEEEMEALQLDLGDGGNELPESSNADLDTHVQTVSEPVTPRVTREGLGWESRRQNPYLETTAEGTDVSSVQRKKQKPVIVIDNRFQVVSQLGKGVMCNVYKVKELESGTMMVLKMLPREAWTDSEKILRARAEAQIITQLEHENLIPFRCFDATADGKPFILMDYLHGITLLRAIKASDGLPLPRVVQVLEQLCRGLTALHNAGVAHRDIRPDNIMFLSKKGDYNLKIVDFGLAKLVCEGVEPMRALEATGEIFGNPPYMSPEECRGEKLDTRSDIYSIGCVIYTAMTGQPPFAGSNSQETLRKQIVEELLPPTRLKKNLASAKHAGWVAVTDLEYIVMKCLEKDPSARYQRVEEILSDLDKLRKSIPLQQSQPRRASGLRTVEPVHSEAAQKTRSLTPILIIVITVVLVALVGAGLMLMPKAAPDMVQDSSANPDIPAHKILLPAAPQATEDAKHIKVAPTPPQEL